MAQCGFGLPRYRVRAVTSNKRIWRWLNVGLAYLGIGIMAPWKFHGTIQ